MDITSIRSAKVLVAMGAVSLALATAAGPASATDNAPAPSTDKKGCTIKTTREDGQEHTWNFKHGDVVEFRDPGGHVYSKSKCNDGKWEETMTISSSPKGTFTTSGTSRVSASTIATRGRTTYATAATRSR